MPRLAAPRIGRPLQSQPTGIPLFFERRSPRLVTADPWAFLRHTAAEYLDAPTLGRAIAYVAQAFDFFQAAENPQIGSRPLLFYYSFLNLAKLALLIHRVPIPLRLRHGIEDPAANTTHRLRVAGQQVRANRLSTNHTELFPEFWELLGGDASSPRTFRLLDIFGQVPTIHRTFTRVTGRRTLLMPISRIEALKDDTHVWLRIALRRRDRDVELALPGIRRRTNFRSTFQQVASPRSADGSTEEIWFETSPIPGRRRAVDTALTNLSSSLFRIPFSAILTARTGYRMYVVDIAPNDWLHPLIAIYSAMFYLGSVTRYKPDVFDKILGGRYAWIIHEFIATAPAQFLYILASVLADAEVLQPYGVLR
jgi:hypothetical protein